MAKSFILFDGRAKSGDSSDATVLDTADTEEEAIESGKVDWRKYDAIWYEFDLEGNNLVNGKPRWDLPPAG